MIQWVSQWLDDPLLPPHIVSSYLCGSTNDDNYDGLWSLYFTYTHMLIRKHEALCSQCTTSIKERMLHNAYYTTTRGRQWSKICVRQLLHIRRDKPHTVENTLKTGFHFCSLLNSINNILYWSWMFNLLSRLCSCNTVQYMSFLHRASTDRKKPSSWC